MGIPSPWKKESIGGKVASPMGECASTVQVTKYVLLPSSSPLEQSWEEAGKENVPTHSSSSGAVLVPFPLLSSSFLPPTPSLILPPHCGLVVTPSGKARPDL